MQHSGLSLARGILDLSLSADMNYSLHELLMSGLALLTLPIFFIAPGYVVASLTGLFHFRDQGWLERALWAVALSEPVSLLLAVHPLLPVSPSLTTSFFVAIFFFAIVLGIRDWRRDGPGKRLWWDRNATIATFSAVLLIAYCSLSAVPIAWHGRLYESAIWQDWNVRIQLVNSAIRGGNIPRNPMFAPGGQAAPLRYYYFWYVLCARMHDLAPVSARAILTASCSGASLSLLGFLFLSLKYLGTSTKALRNQCTAMLLAACILGLDLVAAVATTLHHRIYPDLQFWLWDRTPRLLHIVLWSPHHAAGLVSAGLGTLLLVRCLDCSSRQRVVHMLLAGICFAASAGTSTFITALFASALLLILVDALLRRQWAVVLPVLGAAVLALLLDASFLHGLLIARAGSVAGKSGSPLLQPLPRFMSQALQIIWTSADAMSRRFYHHRLPKGINPSIGLVKWELRILHRPIVMALFLLDLGFFAFVLFWQARKDFLSREPMPRAARVLWLVFLGIGIPGTRLTSAPLQTNNDFARHAGLCMEFVLLLWSAPRIADFFAQRRVARQTRQRLVLPTATRFAIACAVIGIAGQVAQIVLDRIRTPLTDMDVVPHVVVAEHVPHIGYRFGQIQQAMAAAARITPPDGIVQGDPHSILAPVFLLYTNRQMAASDDGCNTPFGGDPQACRPLTRSLIQLFGGTGARYFVDMTVLKKPIPFNPSLVTPDNFARVCAGTKINAVVIDYTAPAWWDKNSWVWKLKPSFSNSTAKVFPCSDALPANGS